MNIKENFTNSADYLLYNFIQVNISSKSPYYLKNNCLAPIKSP